MRSLSPAKGALLSAALVAAIALLSPPRIASAQTADEVISRHLAAIGGKTAVDRVKDKVKTWSVTIHAFDTTAEGSATFKTRKPNLFMKQVELNFFGNPVQRTQGFDGKTGWEENQGLASPLEGEELTELGNLALRANQGEILWYRPAGAKVALQGRQEFEGKQVHVLVVTPKEGSAVTYFIDAQSYLILRMSGKVFDRGREAEVVTRIPSYRLVEGLRVIDKMDIEIRDPSMEAPWRFELKLKKVTFNSGLEEEDFLSPFGGGRKARPEEKKNKRGWY